MFSKRREKTPAHTNTPTFSSPRSSLRYPRVTGPLSERYRHSGGLGKCVGGGGGGGGGGVVLGGGYAIFTDEQQLEGGEAAFYRRSRGESGTDKRPMRHWLLFSGTKNRGERLATKGRITLP